MPRLWFMSYGWECRFCERMNKDGNEYCYNCGRDSITVRAAKMTLIRKGALGVLLDPGSPGSNPFQEE